MHVRRALALVGAVTAASFAACKDVPFAPRWDADMYLPLSTKAIYLNTFFPAGVPANTSGSVSFPPQTQDVTGAIGDVLKNVVTDPARARTIIALTLTKTTPISTIDTLFIAPDSLSLRNANSARVVFPISMATTDVSKSDSVTVALASITMLHDAATSKTPLWIQLRGQVTNSGSSISITPADSITVRLTVTTRIAVSH